MAINPKVIVQVAGLQGPQGERGRDGRNGAGVPSISGWTKEGTGVLKTDGKSTYWAEESVPTKKIEQGTPSNTWILNHNLGKFPSVTIVDSAGSVVIGEVVYLSENTCIVKMSSSFSGTAYLN